MTIMTNSMPSDTSPTALPEGWRLVRLEQIAREYISGGTPSTKQSDYWDGNIAWTTSSPISEDDVSLNTAQRFISERGIKESASRVVPRNSLLVGTRVGVGKAVVNLIDIAISQDLTGIVLHDNVADPIFIVYQFKTGRVQQFFDDRKRGTTIKGISRFDLQSLLLNLPPLAEQRAIASTLRAAQAAVQARRRAIELERERKAALMQALFTKGTRGEATKMTEIGEVPESWEVKPIGYVAEVAYGLTVNQNRRASRRQVPLLTVANVSRGALHLEVVREIGVLEGDEERYRLQRDDVLIVEGNGNPKLLGSAAIWRDELPLALHQNHLIRVRANQAVVLAEWIMNYLNSDDGIAQLFGRSTTSSGLHSINSRLISELQLPLPPLTEQREIAETLRACDEVIAGLEREAALHEELFRALLEELMTGRVRVPVQLGGEGTS